MTNLIQQFLAGRAERQTSHITNAEQPVTRKEFTVLAAAVTGLIEDVEAVLKPERITAAINAAMKDVAPIANSRRGNPLSQYLAPSDDDDGQAIANQRNGRPAANKRLYLAPEGD